MSSSVPPLLLIGAGVLLAGETLHVVGLATTHWSGVSVDGYDSHNGLFKICGGDSCVTIDKPSDELKAVRAMAILGMLFGLAAIAPAILFVVFKVTGKPAKTLILMVSMAASIAAGFFIIVGVGVYGAKIFKDLHDLSSKYSLEYSFILCIVGALMIGAGGILSFIGGRSAAD